MTEALERRLWWRHILSFLRFPATMAIVIPALIVVWADVRLPDAGSPLMVGLMSVGVLLIAG